MAAINEPAVIESLLPQLYMESTASLIGLPIAAQYADEVRKNLERAAAIAVTLLATPIGDEVESAAVFQP